MKTLSLLLGLLIGHVVSGNALSGNALSSNNLSASDNTESPDIQRIVALSPHAVEMLYAIGAGDRIVGTVEYADYPKEALAIPRIGNYAGIQIERVVELKPDLVVTWKTGNRSSDLEKIESLGLRVFDSKPKNISGIADEVRQLGKLTGLDIEANVVAKNILEKHQKIKAKYATKKSVKVFYQLWHDPLRTVGPKSWIHSMIEDCNGHNIFEDTDSDYPLVAFESVLMKNPEVIIVPHHSGNVGAKTAIWDSWSSVNAVKNNRLTTINGDLLHRFSPRAIDGLEKLCSSINDGRGFNK